MDEFIPAYAGATAKDFNLVLEGGALRCMFTAGVTDFFMEQKLYPKEAIGVSAGALVAQSYIAGALGRACYLNLKYANDWRYLSLRSFAVTGNACGRDFMFNKIPQELEPLEDRFFDQSITKLTAVCSDLDTGEADYHTMESLRGDLPYLIASSSLPLVSQIVEVDGKHLLDGGICDSIPLAYSWSTGMKKHVLVLTRDINYQRQPSHLTALEEVRFADYPLFLQREQMRYWDYGRQVAEVNRQEREKAIFVLRPQKPVTVRQMEKDTDALLDLYEQGYHEALVHWSELQEYLEL